MQCHVPRLTLLPMLVTVLPGLPPSAQMHLRRDASPLSHTCPPIARVYGRHVRH